MQLLRNYQQNSIFSYIFDDLHLRFNEVIYQSQRMNKFKFEPLHQQRRNNVQHKSYDVAIMITLEKCTQIIRQDRLFLRTQIINGNNEVIEILKKYSKASHLQNLQIKLRKYLQETKNRLKSQQLNKFKETLKINATLIKKTHYQNSFFSNTSKQIQKKSMRTQPNRSYSTRNAKSQQHQQGQMTSNQSLKHFQELLKLKYSQEVIEQRQSQNVTSARQRRHQNEPNRLKPSQQSYDSIENKKTIKASQLVFPHRSNQKVQRSFYKDKEKPPKEQNIGYAPWQFQKKAKKALYSSKSNQSQEIQQIHRSLCRKDRSCQKQSQEQSIYDKHFNASNNNSAPRPQQNQSISIKDVNSFLLKDLNITNILSKDQLKQLQIDNEQSKQSVRRNLRKSQESLFTPIDILMQCRNFLKGKDITNNNIATQQFTLFSKENPIKQIVSTVNQIKKTLPSNFSIQNLLECLMEITEMQPFISGESLKKFISLHQNHQALQSILTKEGQSYPSQICLTTLANKINKYYNSQLHLQYPHNDKSVNSVYNLLDIDNKGFICQFDITSFLQQIKAAQVENYQQVNTELWRLFHGADFANQRQITYWHFYLVKNSQEFTTVKMLLDGFDFQIEAENNV